MSYHRLMIMRSSGLALCLLALTSCSTTPADDEPVVEEWPFDLPGIAYEVDAGAPIEAPRETWTYVPVADALCANGTSTGMAVNLTDRSDRVLIFLAGGGACWEAAACASGAAVNIQATVGEAQVLAEAGHEGLSVIFGRDDEGNPFRDASFVYIPYCTGDLYSGTRAHTYEWFGPRVLQHVGANNIDAYLRRLQPSFPGADRVWLAGVSAGGLGATFNWWRVQKAFPWARVDVLNDSGLAISTASDGRYGTMRSTWGMAFPPGCTDCQDALGNVLAYSAGLLEEPRRYSMLGFLQDEVIGLYFGLDGPGVQSRLEALREDAAPGVRTFYLEGSGHVVLADPAVRTSDDVEAKAWIRAFASDSGSWDQAGP